MHSHPLQMHPHPLQMGLHALQMHLQPLPATFAAAFRIRAAAFCSRTRCKCSRTGRGCSRTRRKCSRAGCKCSRTGCKCSRTGCKCSRAAREWPSQRQRIATRSRTNSRNLEIPVASHVLLCARLSLRLSRFSPFTAVPAPGVPKPGQSHSPLKHVPPALYFLPCLFCRIHSVCSPFPRGKWVEQLAQEDRPVRRMAELIE
jgi:hypothetical protein